MSKWVRMPLSEVVALKRGHDLPTTYRQPGDIPIIGSFGVTGWHDKPKAVGPGVTIGRSGASIGTAVFVASDYWPLNTCLYVTDFKGNDPRWVFHMLDVIDFSGYNSGSAQPSLNRNLLAQIPVAVPRVDEQRRIAASIGALDDLIQKNRSIISQMGDLAWVLAASSPTTTSLSEIASLAPAKQVQPKGQVEHYSLPAFDDGAVPEFADGNQIKSGKISLTQPTVLVSRLNPRWERCWMAYPGENAVASTEFVPILGMQAAVEEVWTVTSGKPFWDQMRDRVTGTTGSHQRVEKASVLALTVPDVRGLPSETRKQIIDLVLMIQACHEEILELTVSRSELLPQLMSGKVRVREVGEVTQWSR